MTCNTSEIYDKLDGLQAVATTAGQDAEFQIISLENSIKTGLGSPDYISIPDVTFSDSVIFNPDRPDTDIDSTIDISGQPELEQDPFVLSNLPPVPELDADPVVPQFGDKPGPLTTNPPDEISLEEVEIPDPFTYVLPDPPEYGDITIPSITVIDFSDLISDIEALYDDRPSLTGTDINNYVYQLELLANDSGTQVSESAQRLIDLFETQMLNNNLFQTEDAMIDVLDEIANGSRDVGLPTSVEDQMFSSARSRADAELLMAQEEAFTDMAARGFTIPNGVLIARLDYATQQALLKKKDLNRDLVILHYQEKLKEFWNAVQTVTSISNQRFGLYVQLIDLGLQDVQLKANLLINAVGARTNLYQAQVAIYNASAAIFNTRVQVELAQLERDKLRLEAAQLENNIRETDIRIYVERVRAISIEADIFRTQMEGARINLEAEGLKVQNYNGQVNAYNALVNAKRAEFEAYGEEVRAEVSKIQAYEAQVRAFGERVRAFGEHTNAIIAGDDLRLRSEDQKVRVFEARLSSYNSIIQARAEQLRGQIAKLEVDARIYAEDVQLEVARARVALENVDRQLGEARLQLEAHQFNSTEYSEDRRLRWQSGVEAQKLIFDAYNNLQAAALSAMDVAATVSSQCSESTSVSTNL